MNPRDNPVEQDSLAFMAGGGEMGERTRAFDWSQTTLGPVAGWPQSLKIAIRIMLDSRYAMWLGWGPNFTFFYNDSYARMTLGPKHPWALGKPARLVWPEIWHELEPRAESVVRTGKATWDEGLLLFLERRGFPEETYHTFSYSPVPTDKGEIGGMLCVVTEDTERTLGERRLRTLRELAARTNEKARSAEEACQTAARMLAENPKDLPFVLIYLLDADDSARLVGATGLPDNSPAAPRGVHLKESNGSQSGWPLRLAGESGRVEVVENLESRFGRLPAGVWPEPPHQAVVVPLAKPGQTRPAGFIVAGVNPRRPLDDAYRGFFDLIAGQVATAVANARAYEEERQRAEALAELDRAKTAFFSNVSHEFRTPLTLMLGPVEELLARSPTNLSPAAKSQLEVVNRNGSRLLRLVNSLLDFSRIEAGRVRATFQPTDLAAFTADLSSVFRAAVEKAGLRLVVDCPPLAEPVFVDREMWEKIVLNLLSNAFKFTFVGEITVALRPITGAVELRVSDTGTGIPAEEMPRLFDRFHRVENALGRTHEGSGIGLALVQELVKLHGGSISAQSVLGEGTTFQIAIPLGSSHLPADQVGESRVAAPTGSGAGPFVEEALRWLPDMEPTAPNHSEMPTYLEPLPTSASTNSMDERDALPYVLVADDNADMRKYVTRLLEEHYRIETAPDGEAALAAIQERLPDLVLSDVMMPRLDGFGLLRKLRADPRTKGLPVILLSARAGEESRVEGMQAGADDYLVKPFSARELRARVSAHLQMARLRREANQSLQQSHARFEALLNAAPLGIFLVDANLRISQVNPKALQMFGKIKNLIGAELIEVMHALWPKAYAEEVVGRYRHTLATGEPYYVPEFTKERHDREEVEYYEWQIHRILLADGQYGVVCYLSDVSRHVLAWRALAEAEGRWRNLAEALPNLVWTDTPDGQCDYLSAQWRTYTGIPENELLGLAWLDRVLHPDDRKRTLDCWMAAVEDRAPYDLEYRIRRHDGQYRWFKTRGVPIRDESGKIVKWFGTCTDIDDQKRAQGDLAQSEARFRQLADAMPQIVWTARPDGVVDYENRQWCEFTGLPEGTSNTGWNQIVHPDDALASQELWAESVRTGARFEMEIRLWDRQHQSYRWHLIRTVAVRDEAGNVVRWYGTSTDIDEQKRSGEAARFLAAASAALATVVDYESTLQKVANLAVPYFADWAAADVTNDGGGLRRLAVAHRDPAKVEIVHELTRRYPPDPDAPGGIHSVVRTGQPQIVADITDEMLVQGAKDKEHLRLIRGLGLRSYLCVPLVVSGKAIGALTFATAESGRKYTSSDLVLAEDLSRRAAIAIENTQLYRALKDADRKKDEFLAVLAHELRNPLAPLSNALQIMRMSAANSQAAQVRDMMERQVRQMTRLVDDLLDVSRITSGKITLHKEPLDLADVILVALETSRPIIEAAKHQLIVTPPSQKFRVDGDKTRLAQVLANLLTNSAKYTPEGGHIWLDVEGDGAFVVLRVRDDGLGIPADMVPRIFEMFTQVDRNLGRAQGGLGIGLMLVRSLVQLHGGSVEARSAGPNQGAEFVVRLPLLNEQAVRQGYQNALGLPSSTSNQPRRRILVVDDNVDSAESLAMMLKLQGNEVRTAHNGPNALELAASFTPDVVLLDIGLPGMDGYEVARRMRQMPALKVALLVAQTGWGQEEDRRRSDRAGFDHHFTKPVDPIALQSVLASPRTPAVKR